MKYILVVTVLFGAPDADWTEHRKSVFETTFNNEAACYAAMEETEAEMASRENFLAAVLECRPE